MKFNLLILLFFIKFIAYSQTDSTVNVGYGSILKMRTTEAISTLTKEDFDFTINQNIQQAIQGRVAGVSTYSTGIPGGNMQVIIRGMGTLYGGSDPLYVIDGVPISSEHLNMLNPSDIDTIEILKDASSCAIYGSRGANGVVIITTKHGY